MTQELLNGETASLFHLSSAALEIQVALEGVVDLAKSYGERENSDTYWSIARLLEMVCRNQEELYESLYKLEDK